MRNPAAHPKICTVMSLVVNNTTDAILGPNNKTVQANCDVRHTRSWRRAALSPLRGFGLNNGGSSTQRLHAGLCSAARVAG